MSAISAQLHNSGYYQLNSSGAGSGNTTQTSRSNHAVSGLAAALNGPAPSGFSDAVLLDLSPQAQQYLSGLSAQKASSAVAPSKNDHFVLSSQQRLALASLLEKYKDAPYSQGTFDKIQDDLQQSGIGPNQLSAKERVSSFSSTASLVDALNGGKGTTPGSTVISESDLQKKATNFIQDIVSQWKKVSNDYKSQQSATAVAPIGSADGAS